MKNFFGKNREIDEKLANTIREGIIRAILDIIFFLICLYILFLAFIGIMNALGFFR